MNNKCYKYIPCIDWENELALTDEGILMLCGCDGHTAHEYVEYCENIIGQIDEANRK